MGKPFHPRTTQDVEAYEAGTGGLHAYSEPPYGYARYAINEMIAAADLFHCSVDYLLGRTDNPYFEKDAEVSKSDTWQTGDPHEIGRYSVMALYCKGGRACLTEMVWNGETWIDEDMEIGGLGIDVLRWIELPEDCE